MRKSRSRNGRRGLGSSGKVCVGGLWKRVEMALDACLSRRINETRWSLECYGSIWQQTANDMCPVADDDVAIAA